MNSFDSYSGSRISLAGLAVLCLSFAWSTSTDADDYSRRPLEHEDYDVWKTMSNTQLSRDGKWVVYSVQSGAIDAESTLHIHNLDSQREYLIDRGTGARLTWDSRFVIFRVTPEKKRLKELKKKKTASQELPQPKVQILELDSGKIITVEKVRSFQIPAENSEWVACTMEKPTGEVTISAQKSSIQETYEVTQEGLRRPQKPLKLKSRETLAAERGEVERPVPVAEEKPEQKQKTEADDEQKDKSKAVGEPLMLINLETGVRRVFPSVVSSAFSKDGTAFAFCTSVKPEDGGNEMKDKVAGGGKNPVDGVHVLQLNSLTMTTIAEGVGEYRNMVFSEDGSHMAFLANRDDYEAEESAWSVYLWKARTAKARMIVTEGDKNIPQGWWIASGSPPRFSEDGRRLYFETAPVPDKVIESRIAKSKGQPVTEVEAGEKAKLDVWHWQDPQLQPQQLLQASRERNRSYKAVYHLKSKKVVQLANRNVPSVSIDYRSSADLAVASTNMKYRKMLSWDTPGFQDVWMVDLNTGEHRLCLEKVKWSASISPEGRFVTWFDAAQRKWFAKATDDLDAKSVEISKGIPHPLQDELHDTPNLPRAYGAAGWLIDDQAFLVYDAYDLWKLDPTGKADPVCLTDGFGRANDIRFRYRRLDFEERAIDPGGSLMLEAFHRKTKASGFYALNLTSAKDGNLEIAKPQKLLQPLIMLDEKLGGLRKAQDSDRVVFTRSTFRMCPDLWSSSTGFQEIQRISDLNPQQDEYTWGTAELVNWKATDGQNLDGILLKPDGFDASREYPLMVYFYERNSDNLHSYYTPAAGRSIICHSFYVSRGYVVFIPDIPYKAGEPGPSAANAILPGVEHLIEQGFIDKTKIGMQGHSWGGYQTAYLVTQTDMFACAESGAPVSNMTSAYGGIRWGSGMSRMFQYERTQSRIGDDLWSAREKYIANSPLFHADRINTPLLILHNDEDGAVPWYQGIELFVALRRLEKPAWMLNYNGNPHWVMGDYNRRDFAIRMQQFFDHYLKDAPEPEWMAVGVPAVNKGEKFGLELLEPEKPEAAKNGEAVN